MIIINYNHHQQLSIFYVGLELLRRQRKIDFEIAFHQDKSNKRPVLFGEINSKSFCIDCLDGYNWVDGSTTDNISYFKSNISADFVFKRNFKSDLIAVNANSTIIPFGFNYPIGLNVPIHFTSIKNFLSNPYWTIRYWRLLSGYFDYRTFECSPEIPKELNVLFQVRLWDPYDTKDSVKSEQRNQMNLFRISCVRSLRKCFPSHAVAGVEDSEYARAICPDLIISKSKTSRTNYFNLIRESAIGVTSNGLHHSTGWKIGEYIAASRAIVCERPYFLFPPHFLEGQNYLGFSTPEELEIQVDTLLSQPSYLSSMMKENQYYYQEYQRPDRLVWHILKRMEI